MLGVPMGQSIDNSNIEDRNFRDLLLSSNLKFSAEKFFHELCQDNPLVGVKNPLVIEYIEEFYSTIPQPILVVVSRDEIATAQREEVQGDDFLNSLQNIRRLKNKIFQFIESITDPTILISYERLLQNPKSTVRSLAEFIVGDVPINLLRQTSNMVKPNADMPNDIDFIAKRSHYENTLTPSQYSA